ncbi:hypothetical protein F4559_003050 [Saccharothrix violaceirubra]|uniref:Uncharacterized protein n=1 Tax=Saccharothrix violaceirubra TaxID=413306 RepID=A0A7W7T387_9PSEU|nr:hypothetical protein [Saccharothrix violaceirubra]
MAKLAHAVLGALSIRLKDRKFRWYWYHHL